VRLVLVRHALPERVDVSADGTTADPELTPHGVLQAQRLVTALEPELDAVEALYVSPLARAAATMAPLAEKLGRTPVVDPDLTEFDAVSGQYVPIHEMAAADPATWERMRAGLLPAYVDAAAFAERSARAFERIIAAHPGQATVVVVGHAGVINVWLASLLGLATPLTFPLDYVGITRVVAGRDGRRVVRSVNETGHVADLL
jgi:2,3-bisphosphoglycerate-dependent phosphoglycerate mutase